jgi:hypothetical protein
MPVWMIGLACAISGLVLIGWAAYKSRRDPARLSVGGPAEGKSQRVRRDALAARERCGMAACAGRDC